jgi:hypothetical protein
MTDTNNTIPSESFEAYMWDDLLEVFPQEVQEAASQRRDNSNFAWGGAEYTLIKGHVVERILYDAWDDVVGSDSPDRAPTFARLPSLIGKLVALCG